MLQDFRLGCRVLLQHKTWTLVVVLSLAVGVGANTVIFSAVSGLVLKPLPARDPHELVRFRFAGANDLATDQSDIGSSVVNHTDGPLRAAFSYSSLQDFQKNNRTLSEVFGGAPLGRLNVVVDNEVELATGLVVSGNYYRGLGVQSLLGRTISPEDDRPDAPAVAVLSYDYWTRRLGRDSNVIGRTISINGNPAEVIGITPATFTDLLPSDAAPDITVPFSLEPRLGTAKRLYQPTTWWLQVMGRLKPGTTIAQVQQNFENVFEQNAIQGWSSYVSTLTSEQRALMGDRAKVPRLRIDSGSQGILDVDPADLRAMAILSAVALLVLLIVCANIANLLLARAQARELEMSLRLSLGATRLRLIRQMLTESVLLSSAAGVLALLLTSWGQELMPAWSVARAQIDWRVFVFAAALTLATAVAFGLAPALRLSGRNVSNRFRQNSRTVSGRRSLLNRLLVVAQVAISVVLLVCAGLFVRTLINLERVDLGFNADHLMVVQVDPRLSGYDQARIAGYYSAVSSAIRAVPGVNALGISDRPLIGGGVTIASIFIKGEEAAPARASAYELSVSEDFFETLQIPRAVGRTFTAGDDRSAPKVAVINETAARRYFRGADAIGRTFGHTATQSGEIEVIGIVRDSKYSSVRDAVPPTVYLPLMQHPLKGATFEVRMDGNDLATMNALRGTFQRVDSNVPLMNVSTQADRVRDRIAQERFFARASIFFAAIGLALASIGLFALLSYNVSRRTREIGIRMALGANRGEVARMIVSQSLGLVAAGLAVGIPGAVVAGRSIAGSLYGLSPSDPPTILLSAVTMVVVCIVAATIPVRRATRVDPLIPLRYE